MSHRVGRTNNRCYMCRKPLEQPEKGRLRETCSNACRQKRYRRSHNRTGWNYYRAQKLIAKRLALPISERRFNKQSFMPVFDLGYRRKVYECMACSKQYTVDRINTGGTLRHYCSDACEGRSRLRWKRFDEGLRKARGSGKAIDPRVHERLVEGKFSPLCAHCGTPFAPNTAADGSRLRGRPRKYCSTACGKDAYERRWKTHYRRARVHRMHPCLECGTMFDRTDAQRRRIRRYCSESCSQVFRNRARRARKQMQEQGVTTFKHGVTGSGTAARGSLKNRQKRALRNKAEGIYSGGADQRELSVENPADGLKNRQNPVLRNKVEGIYSGGADQRELVIENPAGEALKNRQNSVLRNKVEGIYSGGADQRELVIENPADWGVRRMGQAIRLSAGVLGMFALDSGKPGGGRITNIIPPATMERDEDWG